MSEPSPPPFDPPPNQPPPGGYPPAGWYGPPPTNYGWPTPAYGWDGDGTPGQVRSTGTSLALFICTLGIYGYVYNYKVHSEMKRYSGRGIGGGIALLLTFLAGVAMPFVTPAEVGSLYALRGQKEPVRGWTGLWVLLPAIGGYILIFVVAIASVGLTSAARSNGQSTNDIGVGIGGAFGLYLVVVIAGGITWFVKTNGALNSFWESLRT